MKKLLHDAGIEVGETHFTIRKGRNAYDLFKFGEKVELYDYCLCPYFFRIIGEAEIIFMFIERYKNIDKKLLTHIKYPDSYNDEDIVTIIFYKRIKKENLCLRRLKTFFKNIFK